MTSPDLERLRFFLAGLREPAPSRESERQALDAFGRLWKASDPRSRWQRTGQDRRKGDRRKRAVLVRLDRRSGWDRRKGDRRRD